MPQQIALRVKIVLRADKQESHGEDDFFQFKVEDICSVYELAVERVKHGELTFSLDEMPGIQALERKMPDMPMKPLAA